MANVRSLKFRRKILMATLVIATYTVASWSATIEVTTTADSGVGSLRQAIIDSNTNLGLDHIEFNIPAGQCQGSGVCVINLATSLPTVTDGLTLDGTTQPRHGSAPANVCATATSPSYLRIQLVTSADYILNIESVSTGTTFTVRGLAFSGQSNTNAIRHHTFSRGLVQCNHFGIDGSGTVALDLSTGVCVGCYGSGGNAWVGTDGDGWNDVGERNVFGTGLRGVNVNTGDSSYPNWIAGNYFGVGADGVTEMDLTTGVYLRQDASQTLIGTNEDYLSDELERNIFAYCSSGVWFNTFAGAAYDNFVIGNWVGHDARGGAAANTRGINVDGYSTDAEISRNRIMANQWGIYVQDDATFSISSGFNCIVGNDSGLQHTGTATGLFVEDNYWGAADGPSGLGSGSGDTVSVTGSGSVDFNPWLTTPANACAVVFVDGFESGNASAWSKSVGL